MKLNKNSFKNKLIIKGLTESTIQSYVYALEKYELWLNHNHRTKDESFQNMAYRYLKYLKKKYNNNSTLYGFIYPLKLYYNFFGKDNPFLHIQFKRNELNVKDNSFTLEELEEIFDKYPQNTTIEVRDKVLLSLYIYQGIRTKEVKSILVEDIEFSKYRIRLKGDEKMYGRKINLNIKQILLLNDYLTNHRKQILNGKESELLIVTNHKNNRVDAVVYRLSAKLRKQLIGFENLNQIRKSVIQNWVKEHNLRKAQYLSGHKYISSTERFITRDISGLTKKINKYFPLNN